MYSGKNMKLTFKILSAIAISTACTGASAKMKIDPLMAAAMMDPQASKFATIVLLNKEDTIDNDATFRQAASLLPITIDKYTLKSMNKADATLFLNVDTTDPKPAEVLKKDPRKFKQAFTKGACRLLTQFKFKTIDSVHATITENGNLVSSMSRNASDCADAKSTEKKKSEPKADEQKAN